MVVTYQDVVIKYPWKIGTKELDNRLMKIIAALIIFAVWLCFVPVAFAASDSLTGLFETKAFQGSWAVINKFSWVGYIMNFIISVFSLLGLFMIFYQRLISLLYLSSRGFFDNVYDVKNDGKGGSFFGVPGMAKSIFAGNRGVGADAIVGIFYALVPNVKAYSDFNPEKMPYNLTEDDNVATYMLKTFLPTILLVFVFTIGFSGTMFKGYGMVVNGMAAFADRAVAVNLEAQVNRLVNTGDSYKFTLGNNDYATGRLAQKLSQDIYGKVLSKTNVLDTPSRLIIGKAIETWVWKDILGGSNFNDFKQLDALVKANAIGASANNNGALVASQEDVNAIRYDLVVNGNGPIGSKPEGVTSQYGEATGLAIKMSDFLANVGQASGTELYIHITFNKDSAAESNFFLKPKTNNGGNTNTNGTGTGYENQIR